MNLNFCKLKSSLLSLGLSATLFCSSLACFHVSANDPIREKDLRAQLIELKRKAAPVKYQRGRAGAVFAALWNELLTIANEAAASGVIDEAGRPVPLHTVLSLIRLGPTAFAMNTPALAKDLGRSKSCVNNQLWKLGYTSSPLTTEHMAQLGMRPHQCRSWTVRTLCPPENTGEDGGSADEALTSNPPESTGDSFAPAEWPRLSLPDRPAGAGRLALTDTGRGDGGFFALDHAPAGASWFDLY
jgi:hypothetical protein